KQIAFLANSSVALKLNIDFAKQTPELSVIAPTTKSITSTQQIYYNSFGGYEAYTQKVAQIRANSAADFESQLQALYTKELALTDSLFSDKQLKDGKSYYAKQLKYSTLNARMTYLNMAQSAAKSYQDMLPTIDYVLQTEK